MLPLAVINYANATKPWGFFLKKILIDASVFVMSVKTHFKEKCFFFIKHVRWANVIAQASKHAQWKL